MQLRIAKHRLVRFLRATAPIVFFTLVGALTWNYWTRRKPPVGEAANLHGLGPKLATETEGLTFQHTEGSRVFYTLKAQKHEKETLSDAPHLFHGVEVTVYGEKPSDPERRITSDECTYEPKTGDIQFRGNVSAQLDEKTRGRTAVLNYLNHARLATSRTPTSIEQTGGMTAAADRMEFGIDSGVLKLNGNVHATMAGGVELDSKAAVFNRKESWVTASNDVYLRMTNGWVRGTDARADLDPDTFRPRKVRIDKTVTAETHSPTGTDTWKLAKADRLDLAIADGKTVDSARAYGRARIEKVPKEGREQKLTGDEIASFMDETGGVESVEATGEAVLDTGTADRPALLTAPKIRIDPGGTIVTEGLSKLETKDANNTTIDGRNFKVEQGNVITFTTTSPAHVASKPPAGQSAGKQNAPGTPAGAMREMWSQRSLTAYFDSKTNTLQKLVADGSTRFTDGTRNGKADRTTATDGGDNLVLEGAAKVVDPKTTIDGPRIEILQRGNSLKASGGVTTTSQSANGPVTVTARSVSTESVASSSSGQNASQKVQYMGDVVQWLQSDSGPIKITASEAKGDATEMTYRGSVVTVLQSKDGAVRIDAAQAAGNAEKMTYTGGVQLWRDNIYIAADKIDVWPKEKRFRAEIVSNSKMDTLTGKARILDYSDAKQTIVYEGGVELSKPDTTPSRTSSKPVDMTIKGDRVDAVIKDGRITTATAKGAVTVTQGARVATGDNAVYEAAPERARLTGKPAHLHDPEQGDGQGAEVVMDFEHKNATINGAVDGGPQGRVISRPNLEPKPRR